MTKAKCKRAAELRGIHFTGERKWLNSMVGYGYEFFSPSGRSFRQADTLEGSYRQIMEFPRLKGGIAMVMEQILILASFWGAESVKELKEVFDAIKEAR